MSDWEDDFDAFSGVGTDPKENDQKKSEVNADNKEDSFNFEQTLSDEKEKTDEKQDTPEISFTDSFISSSSHNKDDKNLESEVHVDKNIDEDLGKTIRSDISISVTTDTQSKIDIPSGGLSSSKIDDPKINIQSGNTQTLNEDSKKSPEKENTLPQTSNLSQKSVNSEKAPNNVVPSEHSSSAQPKKNDNHVTIEQSDVYLPPAKLEQAYYEIPQPILVRPQHANPRQPIEGDKDKDKEIARLQKIVVQQRHIIDSQKETIRLLMKEQISYEEISKLRQALTQKSPLLQLVAATPLSETREMTNLRAENASLRRQLDELENRHLSELKMLKSQFAQLSSRQMPTDGCANCRRRIRELEDEIKSYKV